MQQRANDVLEPSLTSIDASYLYEMVYRVAPSPAAAGRPALNKTINDAEN
jgi:hypothetical protein